MLRLKNLLPALFLVTSMSACVGEVSGQISDDELVVVTNFAVECFPESATAPEFTINLSMNIIDEVSNEPLHFSKGVVVADSCGQTVEVKMTKADYLAGFRPGQLVRVSNDLGADTGWTIIAPDQLVFPDKRPKEGWPTYQVNLFQSDVSSAAMLTARIEALNDKATAAQATLFALQQQVTDTTSVLTDLRQQVTDTTSVLTDLRQQVTDVTIDVATLQATAETLVAGNAALAATQQTLLGSVSALQTSQTTLLGSVASLQGSVNALATTEQTLLTNVGNLQSNVSSLQATAETLVAGNAALAATQQTLLGSVSALQTSQTTLLGDVANLQSNVSSLQAAQVTAQTSLDAMNASIASLQTTEAGIQASIDALTAQLASLTEASVPFEVYDKTSGTPITGAVVSVVGASPPNTETTSSDGVTTVAGLTPDVMYFFSVSAPGYVTTFTSGLTFSPGANVQIFLELDPVGTTGSLVYFGTKAYWAGSTVSTFGADFPLQDSVTGEPVANGTYSSSDTAAATIAVDGSVLTILAGSEGTCVAITATAPGYSYPVTGRILVREADGTLPSCP